jgi:hypothetical protein
MSINSTTVPIGNGTLTPADVHRPDMDRRSNWSETDEGVEQYIRNKPEIPEPVPQVQADWNQADNTKVDFIKNKPTIPSIPSAPAAGEADATYVLSVTAEGVVDWVAVE